MKTGRSICERGHVVDWVARDRVPKRCGSGCNALLRVVDMTGNSARFGTCRHTFQIQEMYGPEGRVMDTTDELRCQYLDSVGPLPPPVARANGGFHIRRED